MRLLLNAWIYIYKRLRVILKNLLQSPALRWWPRRVLPEHPEHRECCQPVEENHHFMQQVATLRGGASSHALHEVWVAVTNRVTLSPREGC